MSRKGKPVFQRVIQRLSFGTREIKFAQDSVYYYLSGAAGALSRFLSTVFFIRSLGPHDYGLLVLAVAVTGSINGLMDPRAHEGLIHFLQKAVSSQNKRNVLRVIYTGHFMNAVMSLVSFCVIYASAPVIAVYFLHQPVEKTLIRIYGVVWFLSSFTVTPYSIFLVFKRHKLLNVLIALNYLFKLVLPVSLLFLGLKGVLSGFIAATGLSAVLFTFVSSRMTSRYAGAQRVSLQDILKTSKEIFPFVTHSFISETFKTFASASGILILGFFRQPTEVSYYKIAYAYAGISAFLFNPVSPLAFNKLNQLWADGKMKLFHSAVQKGRVYLFLLSLLISVCLAVPASSLLPLFFNVRSESAVKAAYLLLLAYFYLNAYSWVRPFVLAIGRPGLSTLLNAAHILVSVPLCIFTTHRFGITGTAFGVFASAALLHLTLSTRFLRYASVKKPHLP